MEITITKTLTTRLIVTLLILTTELVSGNNYSDPHKCLAPDRIASINLKQYHGEGGGFVKSFVNFPPAIITDQKCNTFYFGKLEGNEMQMLYTFETITSSKLVKQRYVTRQLRPGVFESRSVGYSPHIVWIDHVVTHNRDFTVLTTCYFSNGKFVGQLSSQVSRHRVVHPDDQIAAYAKAAYLDVERSIEISQYNCHYNNRYPNYGPGSY